MAATARSPSYALAGVFGLVALALLHVGLAEAFCTKFVEPEGYSCQEYKMYTEDGYAVLLHRVGATGKKPPAASESVTSNESPSVSQRDGIPAANRPDLDLLPAKTTVLKGRPRKLAVTPPPDTSSTGFIASPDAQRPAFTVPSVSTPQGAITELSLRPPSSLPLPPLPTPSGDTRPSSLLTPSATISPSALSTPSTDMPPASLLTPSETDSPSTLMSPSRDISPSSQQNPGDVPPSGGEVGSTPEARPRMISRRGDPVLLLHPELLNGDCWFKHVDPEGKSALLPFLLADEGFDVWIGHQRATYWSHDHLSVSHNERVYWNWTWDQIAQHDVPTMLRFTNSVTNAKVHVIGVSQSATIAAAAATRKDVGTLMNTLTLVGPTIYRGRRNLLLTRTWTWLFDNILTNDRVPRTLVSTTGQFNFSRDFHVNSLSMTGPKSEMRFAFSGFDCCISPSLNLFDNGWDGTTSSSNIEHVQQAMMTNTWRQLDCGSSDRNMEIYGQPMPPFYEAKDIPDDLPVLVVHGGKDLYSPLTGIMEVLATMPSRPSRVFLPSYAHMDLFFSERRAEDVYDPICGFLKFSGSA